MLPGGRCLPAFGLGIANTAEPQAFQVDRKERAPWLEEAMPLMRRLWTEDVVDHDGERFHLKGARVLPKPKRDPFEVWLGGQAPSELRRTGRLAEMIGEFIAAGASKFVMFPVAEPPDRTVELSSLAEATLDLQT